MYIHTLIFMFSYIYVCVYIYKYLRGIERQMYKSLYKIILYYKLHEENK